MCQILEFSTIFQGVMPLDYWLVVENLPIWTDLTQKSSLNKKDQRCELGAWSALISDNLLEAASVTNDFI